MTLKGYIDSLPQDQQYKLAIRLTKLVLPIWEDYAGNNKTTYRDTVVGLTHVVDKNLLRSTVYSVEKYLKAIFVLKPIIKYSELNVLKGRFSDPVVALQDLDWELPNPVLMAFYSIHNLLDAVLGKEATAFDESMIYVTVNQAIQALESSKLYTTEEIKSILYNNNGR